MTPQPRGRARTGYSVHEDSFEFYVSGRAALDRGDLGTAEAAFLAMVERDDVATDAIVLGHAHVGLAQVALARQQLEWAARYLSLADVEVEAVEGELRARLLTNISALWSELGNIDRSRAALERLLALLNSSPVETFLQRHELLIAAADLSVRHGHLADAERVLVRADDLAENESERADSSYWRARIAQERGDPNAAQAYFETAFAGAESGEKKLMALANTALMHYDAGNLTAAEQGFRELLDAATGQVDARGLAHGYAGLARIATDRNQLELAREYGEKAVSASASSGDAEAMAIALTAVGIVLAGLGDLDGAAEAYAALGELLDADPTISESTRRRGRAALESNEAQLAVRRGDMSALGRLAAASPAPSLPSREELDDLVQSGVSRVLVGDWDGAKRILVSALRRARDTGQVGAKLRAALELATVYSLQAQFEPAHRACGEGIESLEQLRARAGAEQARVAYVKDKADAYALMVRLCLILTVTQRRRPRLREAVEYVERAKSRVLADSLGATADLRLPEAVPLKLAEAERAALARIRELNRSTRTADVAAEEAFAQAQALLDDLVARIGVFVPEYESLRRGVPASFAELRSLVGERGEEGPQ